MITTKGQFRVGTSGYQYDHWKGLFYPEKLSKRDWFAHYVKYFDTVEINNTFYGLPSAETFNAWRKQAPAGFCYTLKFSRYGFTFEASKGSGFNNQNFLKGRPSAKKVSRPDSGATAAKLECRLRTASETFLKRRQARYAGHSKSAIPLGFVRKCSRSCSATTPLCASTT